VRTFLHVGCGQNRKDKATREFSQGDWKELRFDIDPKVKPDYVGTMTDMSTIDDGFVDAIYSSHNIEHLFVHEVPEALAEFKRVLAPDGFVVITCPDLQEIAKLIAEDKLMEPAYMSPAGPITPLDILYGFGASIFRGNVFMAHKTGFTEKTLRGALSASGFATVATVKRPHPYYDLWLVASVKALDEGELRGLAVAHFPSPAA
jgi:SAM-dependent methyltransferase